MLSDYEILTRYERENDFEKFIERMQLTLHHTATYPCYIPVDKYVLCRYSGRFGCGYAVLEHNPHSNRYCIIHYYI